MDHAITSAAAAAAAAAASASNSKKRRIMIITADESIIEQIQNNNHPSSFQSIVIESRNDNIEFSLAADGSESRPSTSTRNKSNSLICVVCGSKALGYNFDAITCESCKAFFRRNALKSSDSFQCRRKGDCEINIETRRRCSSCRLNKCLRQGMKADRLLTAEEKAAKRRKIEENRNAVGGLLPDTPPTDEDDDDQSNFLLQNEFDRVCFVPNLYHDFSVQFFKDRDADSARSSLSKTSIDSRRALMTTSDLKRLEQIQTSYDKRIELAAQSGLSWTPNDCNSTLLQRINARSISALRLLLFLKQIPEFNQLNVEDKVVLTKYNLMPLVIINGTLYYRPDIDQVIETEGDIPWNTHTMEEIYGSEICVQIKKNFECFVELAQYDQKIILLAMLVLIFTRAPLSDVDVGEPLLNDPVAVYRAQSFYTEFLWKYMETVHGLQKTAKIFQEFITNFITWKTLDSRIRRSIQQVLSPTDVNDMIPLMKSLLHLV